MRTALLALLTSAVPVTAEVPFLALPLDCTLGQTCYIEDYMDADPGDGMQDYTCGIRARDGHGGVDFAVESWEAMTAGVAVMAAADGVVDAVRDGEADLPFTPDRAEVIDGRECGNAVRIVHGNGYQTLYCHLRNGSVSVVAGQDVVAGTPIGLVGLSGQTNFPHLHLTVLKDGKRVDPFAPTAAPGACGASDTQLFLDPIAYEPTGIITAGFSDAVPEFAAVRDGSARRDSLPGDAPLVLYARFGDAQHLDRLDMTITGPGGAQVFQHDLILKSPQRDRFQAAGRRAPAGGWPKGTYTGKAVLTRGDTLLAVRYTTVEVQ